MEPSFENTKVYDTYFTNEILFSLLSDLKIESISKKKFHLMILYFYLINFIS
jgi:hypothetical protein